MGTARARHILVSSQEECEKLKEKIESGSDFEEIAKEHSTCPSGKSGGDLGVFSPGQMVQEFDQVVFNDEVGKVHGPVKTDFGYHLIEITDREERATALLVLSNYLDLSGNTRTYMRREQKLPIYGGLLLSFEVYSAEII
jgi:peptidyl-prolyl cis-trans isomerase C